MAGTSGRSRIAAGYQGINTISTASRPIDLGRRACNFAEPTLLSRFRSYPSAKMHVAGLVWESVLLPRGQHDQVGKVRVLVNVRAEQLHRRCGRIDPWSCPRPREVEQREKQGPRYQHKRRLRPRCPGARCPGWHSSLALKLRLQLPACQQLLTSARINMTTLLSKARHIRCRPLQASLPMQCLLEVLHREIWCTNYTVVSEVGLAELSTGADRRNACRHATR